MTKRRSKRRKKGDKPAARKPLGDPLPLTDEDLGELAQITDEDILAAQQIADEEGDGDLLKAEPEPEEDDEEPLGDASTAT